jgi:hypothetical protein
MHLPVDDAGPTAERLSKAGEFFQIAGRSRSARRITMLDDELGRAWMREIVSAQEYSALRRYALHWVAAGLQGPIGSVDLNRIYAHDPATMSGLCKSEAQLDHKRTYYAAKDAIGFRPSYVADQVACFGRSLLETGLSMGLFKSPYRARLRAARYLSEGGWRLSEFFEARAKAGR